MPNHYCPKVSNLPYGQQGHHEIDQARSGCCCRLVAFNAPLMRQSRPPHRQAGKARGKTAARQAKPTAAPAPAVSLTEAVSGNLGQVVFQVLLGELALQRAIPISPSARMPILLPGRAIRKCWSRATELASFGRRFDVAYETSRLWLDVEPIR